MSEILKMEGRLAVLKKEAAQLELSIRGDIKAVREVLDPFADNLAEIQADVAAAQAVELSEKVIRLKEMRDKKRRIEQELGR